MSKFQNESRAVPQKMASLWECIDSYGRAHSTALQLIRSKSMIDSTLTQIAPSRLAFYEP